LHVVVHTPALQLVPEAFGSVVVQAWLQLPQLPSSVCSFAQTPLQRV
jgi:hypothetical protein